MKYMLLLCRDEPVWERMTPSERGEIYEKMVGLSDELKARGQYVGGSPLHPSSSATTVRVRNGKRLVTDGPFAETHEQLGGFMMIDVKDLDEAISVAARTSMAHIGAVEVRPVRDGRPS